MSLKKNKAKAQTIKKRFAAKLLFQFRVIIGKSSGKRRLCEKRIVQFLAVNAKSALKETNFRGNRGQYSYKNTDENLVRFEFLGIEELLCLDPGCDSDEVWYEIVELVKPKERIAKFIPAVKKLNAIRNKD